MRAQLRFCKNMNLASSDNKKGQALEPDLFDYISLIPPVIE